MKQCLHIDINGDMRLVGQDYQSVKEAMNDGYIAGYSITPFEYEGVKYDWMWTDDDGMAKNLPFNVIATKLYNKGRGGMSELVGDVVLSKKEWESGE